MRNGSRSVTTRDETADHSVIVAKDTTSNTARPSRRKQKTGVFPGRMSVEEMVRQAKACAGQFPPPTFDRWIRERRVLVAGLSEETVALTLALARAGVRRFTLLSRERVDDPSSNVWGRLANRDNDEKREKGEKGARGAVPVVELAKRALEQEIGRLSVDTVDAAIHVGLTEGLVADHDVLVVTDPGRFAQAYCNDIAVRAETPWIGVAIDDRWVSVLVVAGGDAPCLSCMAGDEALELFQPRMYPTPSKYSFLYKVWRLRERATWLSTGLDLVAAGLVTEQVRSLFRSAWANEVGEPDEVGPPETRRICLDSFTWRVFEERPQRFEGCRTHARRPTEPPFRAAFGPKDSLGALFDAIEAHFDADVARIELPWKHGLEGDCPRCGLFPNGVERYRLWLPETVSCVCGGTVEITGASVDSITADNAGDDGLIEALPLRLGAWLRVVFEDETRSPVWIELAGKKAAARD